MQQCAGYEIILSLFTVDARIGYFELERRLKDKGFRIEPLANGSMIVFPVNSVYSVIDRSSDRLPTYDPALVEFISKTFEEWGS